MAHILTRSTRQGQYIGNNLNSVKCSPVVTVGLRRESKDSTFFSDDSDSEETYKPLGKTVNAYCSDDSDSDGSYNSLKMSNKDVSSTRRTGRRIIRSGKIDDSEDDDDCKMTLTPCKKGKRMNQARRRSTKPNITHIDDSVRKLSTPRKQKLQTSGCELEDIIYVSPSKQKKINSDLPRTPRHKKMDEQKETQTPSRLFVKLQLTSPKYSDIVEENNSVTPNRKRLFKEKDIRAENDEVLVDEKPKNVLSVYQNAKKALHSTFPTDMPGREKELNELREFVKMHIENRTSGSLYVSGPPGTGKSASLNIILQEDKVFSGLRKVYVNCTAIKSPTAIFSRMAKEMGIKINGKTEKDYSTGVENYLKTQKKMVLLVLDEIDQLENKNQSILYTIFEWPSKPNAKLILVGIANALDLTDRTLPRLQAHCELKPKLLHFPPYTKQQIVEIFTSRLKSSGVLEVFSPVALQMLAGKVAAVSGDVRRALDIGRRVVELVERSRKEETLKSVENLAKDLVIEKPKTVDLKQVMDVLNNVYGTSQNLTDETEDTFPLQQKIVICSLLLMLKKAKNKDVTVGRLHEVYKRVCQKRNILSVDQAEFVGLCSLIETRGILKVAGKKESRLHKVNLVWDEEEVAASLKDKQLMSSILQDNGCLGKM